MRLLERTPDSGLWPGDMAGAALVRVRVPVPIQLLTYSPPLRTNFTAACVRAAICAHTWSAGGRSEVMR